MERSLQERCTYGNEKTLIPIRASSFQHSFPKTTQGLFLIKNMHKLKSHFLAFMYGILESYSSML